MKHKLKGLMTKCIETTVTIKVSTLFRCSFTVSNFVLSFALKMQSVLKYQINVHNEKTLCCFDFVELMVKTSGGSGFGPSPSPSPPEPFFKDFRVPEPEVFESGLGPT